MHCALQNTTDLLKCSLRGFYTLLNCLPMLLTHAWGHATPPVMVEHAHEVDAQNKASAIFAYCAGVHLFLSMRPKYRAPYLETPQANSVALVFFSWAPQASRCMIDPCMLTRECFVFVQSTKYLTIVTLIVVWYCMPSRHALILQIRL